MVQVAIKHLIIHAYHGLHAEEAKTGNDFEINLVVGYVPKHFPITHIHDTVDYTQLVQLVKQKMKVPVPLLETLATGIVKEIFDQYDLVQEVEFSITKINPPIVNMQGQVGVSCKMKR